MSAPTSVVGTQRPCHPCRRMSAFEGKAEWREFPLLTHSGHRDAFAERNLWNVRRVLSPA